MSWTCREQHFRIRPTLNFGNDRLHGDKTHLEIKDRIEIFDSDWTIRRSILAFNVAATVRRRSRSSLFHSSLALHCRCQRILRLRPSHSIQKEVLASRTLKACAKCYEALIKTVEQVKMTVEYVAVEVNLYSGPAIVRIYRRQDPARGKVRATQHDEVQGPHP